MLVSGSLRSAIGSGAHGFERRLITDPRLPCQPGNVTKSRIVRISTLNERPLRRTILLATSLLAAGLVLLPLLVYLVGQLVVGPYEGGRGIMGFVGSIYAGLLRGEVSAWLLVASPALLTACWAGLRRVSGHNPPASNRAADAEQKES